MKRSLNATVLVVYVGSHPSTAYKIRQKLFFNIIILAGTCIVSAISEMLVLVNALLINHAKHKHHFRIGVR